MGAHDLFFFLFLFLFCCCFLFFQDRVSLRSPGCPGSHSVDQDGLELRNPLASASQSAGITGVRHHCLAMFLLISEILGFEYFLVLWTFEV